MSVLSPYRVLDLATERGLLCGQLLGDMGADVIKVEPPGGSSARSIGPFFNDQPHPDRSLYWWAYNRSKRSITLDLEREQGRDIFRRLAARADFLIESDNPGYLAERGLAFPDLSAINPRLIYASITAFGQDGPKASYADSDLIIMAAGGPLILAGDENRPPVRLSVPQAYLHACADTAVAMLAANHERVRTGLGQYIDVAAQQSVGMATQSYILAAALGSSEARRMAGGIKFGPLDIQLVWPAKDGYVAMTMLFGSALGVFTRRFMHYLCEQGFCDEATRDKDWIQYGEMLFDGSEPISEFERIKEIARTFTRSHTKDELLQLSVERGLLITPVTTIDEVVESTQLESRNYFQNVEHPELGASFRYPGPFVKFGATPIEYRRRPPTVGEHNREIYEAELGFSPREVSELKQKGII
ncbi:MAG: CoA transferase [Candidatus Binatus sp.]|uniref:CaiB/BaiF CoA transferase family protein n=1 Tax=Candidatus Binatus sp. TaxID=2811406 RepID=UPI00271BB6DC|nr:CoA transferase [Candidatus Binatus sp.]MDO8431504.1 CoA transferase [Candidatus Binatus sp.]